MTHQGPDWLDQQSRSVVYPEINPAGRFAVHLFGHMHENVVRGQVIGGGKMLRQWQGPSLFSVEKYGESAQEERRHGYSAGTLEWDADTFFLRHWPRKAFRDANGWRFERDSEGCVLDERDGATEPETWARKPARAVDRPLLPPVNLPPIVVDEGAAAAGVQRFASMPAPGPAIRDARRRAGQVIPYLLLAASLAALAWVSRDRIFATAGAGAALEASIRGTFENLELHHAVGSRSSLFLRRSHSRGALFDYDWRLITERRLADGERFEFEFSSDPSGMAIPPRYEVPIRASFYEAPVAIRHLRGGLVLVHQNKREDLKPVDEVSARSPLDRAPSRWRFGLPVAYAAVQNAKQATVYQRLDTADAFLRRAARDELADAIKKELAGIEQVLLSPASSVRLKVGVISAINVAKGVDGDDLSDRTYLAIVQAAASPDQVLAEEAFRFFSRYSVAGAVELTADKGRQPHGETIAVRARNPKDGDFRFVVNVTRQPAGSAQVRVQEIQVQEDSSGGSTRWIFGVVAAGQEAIRLPTRRYEDDGKPTKYAMTPADKAVGTVKVAADAPLPIRIIGYKPKNLPQSD
jgi:hypothetical protein